MILVLIKLKNSTKAKKNPLELHQILKRNNRNIKNIKNMNIKLLRYIFFFCIGFTSISRQKTVLK